MKKSIEETMFNLQGTWHKDITLSTQIATPPQDTNDQEWFINTLHHQLGCDYSSGGYLENRTKLLIHTYLNGRTAIHLGIDYNVPSATRVYTPWDGEIIKITNDKDTNGGWGGRIDLYNKEYEYYFIIAHLSPITYLTTSLGVLQRQGEFIGLVGDHKENGGWFPHVHLQIVTPREYDTNMEIDGYSDRRPDLWSKYPNPNWINSLFK